MSPGRYYFAWNIQGVWSALIWLFYAGMCHAKFIRRWQGTGYAILSIVGFGVVLFTYLGIGLLVGQSKPLPPLVLRLTLEAFEPVLAPSGRPLEMLNTLALYRGEELIKRVQTSSNAPLIWKGLVEIPTSYGPTPRGGGYLPYSILTIKR